MLADEKCKKVYRIVDIALKHILTFSPLSKVILTNEQIFFNFNGRQSHSECYNKILEPPKTLSLCSLQQLA